MLFWTYRIGLYIRLLVFMSLDIGPYQLLDISRLVRYALELVYDILLSRSKTRKRILLFIFCRIAVLRRHFAFTHDVPLWLNDTLFLVYRIGVAIKNSHI